MKDIRETELYKQKTFTRDDYLQKLLQWKDKHEIKVITGIRRCGKSVLLMEFCKELEKQNVEYNQITFLNFEQLENEDLCEYHSLYNFLNNRLQKNKMNYILLDEIQIVQNFEKVVDSLFINPNVDIYLTGSNATLLSGEIATLLSGRYIEMNILPFSYLEFSQSYTENSPNEKLDATSLYRKYITYGGFPYISTILGQDDLIRDYIGGLYSTIVLKDIQQRKKVVDTLGLEKIVKFALQNTGNLFSSKKISDTFVSSGKKISPATVELYLTSLCESFLFYKINRYDVKGKEILKTLEKYYATDLGLRFFMLGSKTGDDGHILENVIFLELLRRGFEIYIGKNGDAEIDFVTVKGAEHCYYQVALTVQDETTLKRELKPLLSIKDSFPKYLITMDNVPVTYHNGIKQIYALDFLGNV